MPTEDWLYRKLAKLNLTLVEGYHSRGSEAGGLSRDVFLRPAKSQSKWYGLFSDHKVDPSAVSSWSTDAWKLNNSYSRIARHSSLSSIPPATPSLRKHCKDGRSQPGRLLLYETRQQASIDACSEYNRRCRIS